MRRCVIQYLGIGIDQHDILLLNGKKSGKMETHVAGTGDDYLHKKGANVRGAKLAFWEL
jgi:hypothetical protein